MSALPRPYADAALQCAPMTLADLDAVIALEQAVYPFPWTRGNFVDSLAAGHVTQLLRAADGALHAYCVALPGVDEMHLLNLTVAPALQGQGLARRLLDDLVSRCRRERRASLWLEVRESNQRARHVYQRYGFESVGLRRGYYPAAGSREDALVMRLPIADGKGADALD
ncbi:MAG TPA: ribosomal protein S18-alanine N-acetyltransferase [Burkholderiaceae bacterium]|nr:ribosomal protein S18-alanine N-acetyltransferase [Burkholderiaceae bacterium]